MDRLEISDVNLSLAFENNASKRIDSEYFKKQYLREDNQRKHYLNVPIGELAFVTDGQHGYHEVDNSSNIHHLTAKNAKNWFSDTIGADRIAKWVDDNNQRSSLKERDIILSTRGSVGYCALVVPNVLPANIDQDVARIALFNENDVNAEYLLTYLNSRFGQDWMLRNCSGMVQQGLPLAKVRDLPVPILEKIFQAKIQITINTASQTIEQSKSLYTQAETILLNALGMADFLPSTEKVNIKSFKDSFVATGRLDAEYYQPKYEEMMAHIATQAHEKLAALVTIQKSIEPGSDAYTEDEDGLPFLRVADYNKFGITAPQKKLKAFFVTENKMKLAAMKPKTGTILFSKDGSVGEAYCLHEDANFITSGAVLHLTVRNTEQALPDYLTLTLNSKLVRMQAERDAGGSIILHWRVSEIENVIVPIVDMTIQTQIADLVQQSFALKAESERLLEMAKRAVEIAIETDEQKAMAYINDQTGVQT